MRKRRTYNTSTGVVEVTHVYGYRSGRPVVAILEYLAKCCESHSDVSHVDAT
jgi:hypothetical protein